MNDQPHRHVFDELIIRPIRADNVLYNGTTMDRALLLRKCACGFEEAFDYGPKRVMIEKLARLKS